MEGQIIKARLIPYCNTLAGWTSSNPVIPQGELVTEVPSSLPGDLKLKLGDGVTPYLSLPYLINAAGGDLQTTLDLGATAQSAGGHIATIQLKDSTGLKQVDLDGSLSVIKIGDIATTGKWSQLSPGTLVYYVNNVPIFALNSGSGIASPYITMTDPSAPNNPITIFVETHAALPRIIVIPTWKSGAFAFSGDGNHPSSLAVQAGLGTGATASFYGNSDDSGGVINFTTGTSVPTDVENILYIGLYTSFPSGCLVKAVCSGIHETSGLAGSGSIYPSFVKSNGQYGFYIAAKNLPASTSFSINYIVVK